MYGNSLLIGQHRVPARARPARRGRCRAGWAAHRAGLANASTAGSCSGGCSAWARRGRSSRCAARPTRCRAWQIVSTWVWPRVNSAEPCVRGQHADFHRDRADLRQRAAVGPRPFSRMLFRTAVFTMRLEHLATWPSGRTSPPELPRSPCEARGWRPLAWPCPDCRSPPRGGCQDEP